ncbi:hypothetical protein V8F20_010532 [Naviculisporaceae sp. PSN 640]
MSQNNSRDLVKFYNNGNNKTHFNPGDDRAIVNLRRQNGESMPENDKSEEFCYEQGSDGRFYEIEVPPPPKQPKDPNKDTIAGSSNGNLNTGGQGYNYYWVVPKKAYYYYRFSREAWFRWSNSKKNWIPSDSATNIFRLLSDGQYAVWKEERAAYKSKTDRNRSCNKDREERSSRSRSKREESYTDKSKKEWERLKREKEKLEIEKQLKEEQRKAVQLAIDRGRLEIDIQRLTGKVQGR